MRDAPPDASEEPIRKAAREEVRRILKEHKPIELDRTVRHELRALLKRYDEEVRGKAVTAKYLERLA
jgi:trimethylamine:corrinoid methyltransferase-like protein